MPRLRIEARAEWRDQSKKPVSKNTLISAVTPGDSTTEWQSEKVRAVTDLKKLIETANAKKKITFLMEPHYSFMIFPKGRDIDFLSIEFREWDAKSANLTSTCKDLTVIKNMPSDNNQNVVTLQFSGKGFST